MMASRSSRRRLVRLTVAAVTGLLVLGVAVAAAAAAQPSGPSAPQVAATSTPARDGKFEFTVQGVKCGVNQVGEDPLVKTAQGTFCLVTMTVKNVGSQSQTFDASDQKAFSANGTSYSTDVTANTYANPNGQDFLNEINPGNQVQVTLVYDVPAGTQLTRLEVHDSPFSGGATVNIS